jgi:hypothetical protein
MSQMRVCFIIFPRLHYSGVIYSLLHFRDFLLNMSTFLLFTHVTGEILNVLIYLEGRVIKNLLRLWYNLHHVFCFEMLHLKRNIQFREAI